MNLYIAFRILARRALHLPMDRDEELAVYESLAALAGAGACRDEEKEAALVVAALREADGAQLRLADLLQKEEGGMTLEEISRRLRLSTRTGRAQLGEAGITERSFRRWLAAGTPLHAAWQLLRLARRVAGPGEPVLVEAEIEGLPLVILRREDYLALAAPAPAPAPHSPTRQLLLACSRPPVRVGASPHSRS